METYSESRFYDWVDRMYNECSKVTGICSEDIETLYGYMKFTDKYGNKSPDTFRKGDYIITFCNNFKIINLKNGKYGWSQQSYLDPEFDGKVALAVAWARYCKNEIPKVEKRHIVISFRKLEPGTELFYSGENNLKTIKFIGIDPDEPSQVILKVTYNDGVKRLITWYTNTRQDAYFYTKE